MHGASLPTFRAAESQKAPRMIHIQDLANHIDAQLKKGRDLLEQMKGDSK
ncbi:pyocin activator PrtN family protein [Klebsiella quasipneumoniae]|nr:pyocin activator PrtN family protein [Klebsiella quasipneumoniae]